VGNWVRINRIQPVHIESSWAAPVTLPYLLGTRNDWSKLFEASFIYL
jgi:hypothetical protein